MDRGSEPSKAVAEGMTLEGARVALPEHTIFFDGICGFCDRSVVWLLRRDRQQRFRFAPLQGATAAQLRASHPDHFPAGLESLVYVHHKAGKLRFERRSRAVLAILRELDGPSRALTGLGYVPNWLADAAYRAFASVRYRVFGRLESCRVPAAHERAQFLA